MKSKHSKYAKQVECWVPISEVKQAILKIIKGEKPKQIASSALRWKAGSVRYGG